MIWLAMWPLASIVVAAVICRLIHLEKMRARSFEA
jgi:hypothetical protein